VLKHIGDLTAAMTNILGLLMPGGICDISVPYDIGLGAWQDLRQSHPAQPARVPPAFS
jgi:hypothetical protein